MMPYKRPMISPFDAELLPLVRGPQRRAMITEYDAEHNKKHTGVYFGDSPESLLDFPVGSYDKATGKTWIAEMLGGKPIPEIYRSLIGRHEYAHSIGYDHDRISDYEIASQDPDKMDDESIVGLNVLFNRAVLSYTHPESEDAKIFSNFVQNHKNDELRPIVELAKDYAAAAIAAKADPLETMHYASGGDE